jgi:hypothetical protein
MPVIGRRQPYYSSSSSAISVTPLPVGVGGAAVSARASSRTPFYSSGQAQAVPVPRTFYIAANGDNRNPGTIQQPWKDFTNVNNLMLNPGDSILIRGGDTIPVGGPAPFSVGPPLMPQGSGTLQRPIVISSYPGPGPTATIQVYGNFSAIKIVNYGGYRIANLNLVGDGRDHDEFGSDRWGVGGVTFYTDSSGQQVFDYIWLESLTVSQFMNGPGIYLFGQPPGMGRGISQFTNVTVTGCEVFRCLQGIVIEIGINVNDVTTVVNNFVKWLTITNNTIHDNPGKTDDSGVHTTAFGNMVTAGRIGLIQNNVVYNNGGGGGTPPLGAAGCLIINLSEHILVQFNQFTTQQRSPDITKGGDGFGIEVNAGSKHIVVQYNWVAGNIGPGLCVSCDDEALGTSPVHDVIFRYNMVVDNDGEIVLANSMGNSGGGTHQIYNIYLYNNTLVHISSPASAHVGTVWLTDMPAAIRGDVSYINLQNNIIYHAMPRPNMPDLLEVNKFPDDPDTDISYLLFQGNLYWSIAGLFKFYVCWNGTIYTSLPQFQGQGTGQPYQERDPNGNPVGLVRDPLFLNATGFTSPSNFQLTAGSPAIGAGQNLFANPYNYVWDPYRFGSLGLPIYPQNDNVPRDYFGAPLTAPYNIGAHQGPSPTP